MMKKLVMILFAWAVAQPLWAEADAVAGIDAYYQQVKAEIRKCRDSAAEDRMQACADYYVEEIRRNKYNMPFPAVGTYWMVEENWYQPDASRDEVFDGSNGILIYSSIASQHAAAEQQQEYLLKNDKLVYYFASLGGEEFRYYIQDGKLLEYRQSGEPSGLDAFNRDSWQSIYEAVSR